MVLAAQELDLAQGRKRLKPPAGGVISHVAELRVEVGELYVGEYLLPREPSDELGGIVVATADP